MLKIFIPQNFSKVAEKFPYDKEKSYREVWDEYLENANGIYFILRIMIEMEFICALKKYSKNEGSFRSNLRSIKSK